MQQQGSNEDCAAAAGSLEYDHVLAESDSLIIGQPYPSPLLDVEASGIDDTPQPQGVYNDVCVVLCVW